MAIGEGSVNENSRKPVQEYCNDRSEKELWPADGAMATLLHKRQEGINRAFVKNRIRIERQNTRSETSRRQRCY